VVTVESRDPLVRERVAEALLELGGSAVEERPAGLATYLRPSPGSADEAALAAAVTESLRGRVGEPDLPVTCTWVPHEDWTARWKEGLGPRRVGERVLVTPSWCEVTEREDVHTVVIDPGMAFGTAEHGTTRGCLRLLQQVVEGGERVLDAGCGSGILGIAAALLGAREVLGIEADADAVPTARENVERNGVADRVRVETGRLSAPDVPPLGPFDGVVANIETAVLRTLVPGFVGALRPGGWLILSGILREEWPAFAHELAGAGLVPVADDVDGVWVSALLRRAGAA